MAGVKKFIHQIQLYDLIALDTVCFIYHFEENAKFLPLTQVLFENFLPQNKIKAIGSTLILTEILTLPIREKRFDLSIAYKSLILGFPNFKLISLDEKIAEIAAYFRAAYNLRSPDAIHLATAYQAQTQAVIGNDKSWKRVKELTVIALDDFIPPTR